MKTIVKIEEAAITAASIYFLSKYNLGLPIWAWVLLFFSPDISMLGYLFNTRVGAYTYNLFHHRALALALMAIGMVTAGNVFMAIGLLLFAHSSFDRMMGYGLKYTDNFKHTNLGWMGQEKIQPARASL
ncbi:MAG: hypothetical protein JWQ84_954 [Mucilaginibacter sp.]|nr:hypothetical protein [Mucilaginibacter sp.]